MINVSNFIINLNQISMEQKKSIKVIMKFKELQFAMNFPEQMKLKQLKFICFMKFRKVDPSLSLKNVEIIDP